MYDVDEDCIPIFITEPAACTLQSYISRERGRISLPPSRPVSVIGARSIPGTVRSTKSDAPVRPKLPLNGHGIDNGGTTVITTRPASRSLCSTPVNGIITSEAHIERPPSIYDERPVDVEFLGPPGLQDVGRGYSSDMEIATMPKTPKVAEVRRSVSSVSRENWKHNMRKKHLPPIFINEAFEANDKSPLSEDPSDVHIKRGNPSNTSKGSLHFYMSSDYHPDYLTDSWPRGRLQPSSSQDADDNQTYQTEDIDDVLDTEGISLSEATEASFAYERESSGRLKTFKGSCEHIEMTTRPSKSMYDTFEDLSKMNFKNEEEIDYENDTIAIDEVEEVSDVETPQTISIDKENKTFPNMQYKANVDSFSSFKPSLTPDTNLDDLFTGYNTRSGSVTTFKVSQSPAENNNTFGNTFTTYHDVPVYQNVSSVSYSSNQSQFTSFKNTAFNTLNSKPEITISTNQVVSPTEIDFGCHRPAQPYKGDISLDDENASSGSASSVTLSPYPETQRRKPWMEDFDAPVDDIEPLVEDSDTDTLRTSMDSADLRTLDFNNYDSRYLSLQRDELLTPVSSIFDEETDRGFEEALEMHVNANSSVYGGVGLCFESIQEEPEDLTSSSGSNPFLDAVSDIDEFKTRAVVARGSKCNSLTSSSTSLNDTNPFSCSPNGSKTNTIQRRGHTSTERPVTPLIFTEGVSPEYEFGDSGFTSGPEKGIFNDASDLPDVVFKGRESPWPEEKPCSEFEGGDFSFETNFCGDNHSRINKTSTPIVPGNARYGESEIVGCGANSTNPFENNFTPHIQINDKITPDILESSSLVASTDSKKPTHPVLEAIRSGKRPAPVRVRSLERVSPLPTRKLPKRGSSFEIRTDYKPAYF